MSNLIRKSISRSRKLAARVSGERIKRRDLLACYLIVANEVMEESEELVFHDPQYSRKHDSLFNHVKLRKNGVIEERRGGEAHPTPLADYLNDLGGYRQLPTIDNLERAIEDIEKSPINKRVTPEMVMKKYRKYRRLVKGTIRKIVIEKMLQV